LTYSLVQSPDLTVWDTVPGEAYTVLSGYPERLDDGKELIRLRIQQPLTEHVGSPKFFRIEVQ
jgi:hypothetical protein